MKLKAMVLLALLTISFVGAEDYEGMITVTTDQYNETIEDETPEDNDTMKETRIVTVQEIRQKKFRIRDDLVPYEPYVEPPEPEPVVVTENKTPISVVVIEKINNTPVPPKKGLYDYIDPTTLIGILIITIAFFIAVLLVNRGKKKQRLTPEEVAKNLLDAGHDEDYVEKVYDKLKREQK